MILTLEEPKLISFHQLEVSEMSSSLSSLKFCAAGTPILSLIAYGVSLKSRMDGRQMMASAVIASVRIIRR
jgi:hypothetical protein